MTNEEILQEINRIQNLLGYEYEVSAFKGSIIVDKKKKPYKIKVTCKDFYFNYYDQYNSRKDNTFKFEFVGDRRIDYIENPKELCNHMEEAFESYINRE